MQRNSLTQTQAIVGNTGWKVQSFSVQAVALGVDLHIGNLAIFAKEPNEVVCGAFEGHVANKQLLRVAWWWMKETEEGKQRIQGSHLNVLLPLDNFSP